MSKVILITGASSGMGKITAEELIKEGHTVYCAARSVEKMKDLENIGGKILKMDVSDRDSIKAGVEKLIQEQGKIDVLWNNAGFGLYGPVEEISIEKARYQFDVNIFGVAEITQLVLPHMRKQNSGLIINTSSIGGKIYTLLGAWYHATKHALEGWSDCLRIELKDFGINVVVLEPGLIDTGFAAGVEHHFAPEAMNGPYTLFSVSGFMVIGLVLFLFLHSPNWKGIGLGLGGEKKIVTILMSDLRGFTKISEQLSPESIISILNNYLKTMTEIILKYNGTIDEFIGDAILVIFGAPYSKDDDTVRALACALEMQTAMEKVNQYNVQQGYPEIEMGIGINTGDVVVGNIGYDKRSKYGVVGIKGDYNIRLPDMEDIEMEM